MKSIDRDQLNPNNEEEKLLREPVLSQEETEEDIVLNLSLRPLKFNDFIGQDKIKDNLNIGIQAAQARHEPLEHLIFSGPPGLGKTTLAHIIAHEMGTKITTTSGPAIERAGDLIGILTNLEHGDILFIDEIHRLSNIVEEFLYPAMEDYKIDFIIDKGPYAKTIKFNLKPFTLIGATTRSGLLTGALRSRFGMYYHLDFYPWPELVKIVKKSAEVLSMPLDEESAELIARRSRGTPRVANRLLRRVRDYSQVKEDGRINPAVSEAALNLQGIDSLGLDDIDRRVLAVIIDTYEGGPVGIESLAATLNEESDTIVDVVEPYLLKIGLLKRTPRGRQATEAAYRHLGRPGPDKTQKGLFEDE
ncbi:MAG: Holliday junction branch migration DNA helicase RuvB [Candidatus Omnitrophica bacterium]|nr:Holliday junction branch migration DNA helicase RuvB [Candidatus Omnitrophota bacterium]MBU4478241.1 Holliday junction branch migration DNA helicase RuvB [Candidatus Omnitrophota bacterium]MCG2703309.1 Holliday junction branch migration DNA helicase RuvB [Candidatus Omnitrophota bacterium]